MSMRFRLNALIIGILGLMLLSFVAMTVWKARARVQAENANIMRVATDFLEVSLANLNSAPDRQQRLSAMLRELHSFRHLSVRKVGEAAQPGGADGAAGEGLTPTPKWFYRLVHPAGDGPNLSTRFEVPDYGAIAITPDPSAEIAEIWGSIVSLALSGLALAVVAIIFSSWIIEQTLRPLRHVSDALSDIESGRYEVSIANSGPPEVSALTAKLNTVAARLKRKKEENRELAQKVITIQDQERRELARELHDEMGPYLFAIRAVATKLKVGLSAFAERGLASQCDTILARTDEVQQVNRRVLQKLRPAGLDELGLRKALESFLNMCKPGAPALDFALTIEDGVDDLDRTAQLTIYRIVQEAVTNALRHAGAHQIDIDVELMDEPGTVAGQRAQTAAVRVVVADDGTGIKSVRKDGFGIVGIEERVLSLGGEVTITDRTHGGTEVRAVFPIAPLDLPAPVVAPVASAFLS